MTTRELVVLGTAAQVPTRDRSHHGALLRWDGEGLLFDPGEGTQRQLTLAGVPATSITRIFITHLHGDHCLGLPGVLQRLALDDVGRGVHLYFPASGQEFIDRLRTASAHHRAPEVHEHPVEEDGMVAHVDGAFDVHARALDHRIDAYGWRLREPDGRRMLPERLRERGIVGADIGRLQREGRVRGPASWVGLDEVSEPRPGQSFAFVMDTRRCDAAVELERGADLVVSESTYLETEADLAASYRHLTAAQAATIAAEAGARRLVLTHFSQRHADTSVFADEARQFFADVHAARDLDRVPVPARG